MHTVPIWLRSSVVSLTKHPFPLGTFALKSYNWVASYVARQLMRTGIPSAVGLRGGAVANCVPGISDLDFWIWIPGPLNAKSAGALLELRRVYLKLKRKFPLLGEIVLLNEESYALMSQFRPSIFRSFSSLKILEGELPGPMGGPVSLSNMARYCLGFEYCQRAIRALVNAKEGNAGYWNALARRSLATASHSLNIPPSIESTHQTISKLWDTLGAIDLSVDHCSKWAISLHPKKSVTTSTFGGNYTEEFSSLKLTIIPRSVTSSLWSRCLQEFIGEVKSSDLKNHIILPETLYESFFSTDATSPILWKLDDMPREWIGRESLSATMGQSIFLDLVNLHISLPGELLYQPLDVFSCWLYYYCLHTCATDSRVITKDLKIYRALTEKSLPQIWKLKNIAQHGRFSFSVESLQDFLLAMGEAKAVCSRAE